jgi:O-acetyl-ADP-ribose deacetylase (regulator of RNase III)
MNNYSVEHGNALDYDPSKNTLIAHVVNDKGLWGAGFVVAISNKWTQPETYYRRYMKRAMDNDESVLGKVQFIDVESCVTIGNMCAMSGVYNYNNKTPLCYDSLRKCLITLRKKAETDSFDIVQMPQIGAGLARGDWNVIEKDIKDIFFGSPVNVIIKML